MRRTLVVLLVVVIAIIAAVVILWKIKRPAIIMALLLVPSRDEMYPPAPPMPAVVSTSVEDLLAQHEAFLRDNAPAALSVLQPGLTDAEIDKLEQQYNLKLTADLRALYRWRNGAPRGTRLDAFPEHDFLPLDAALAERDTHRQQAKAGSAVEQQAYAAFAGHRDPWVGVLVDIAGDGYFFDPSRSESEGSFFFCFAEDGTYVFYPRFRNYLAMLVEGEQSGILSADPRGISTRDFAKAHQLMRRYGAEPPR